MKNSEKLNDLVSHAAADINLCAKAFTVIADAPSDEQGKLLKEFIIGYKKTPSDGELELPEIMDEKEIQRFKRRYGRMVDGFIEELQEQSLSEKAFYDELWKYIQTAPELISKAIRVFALYNVADGELVPYVDSSSMLSIENDEFRALNHQIGEERFAKLEYIINHSFEQQTHRASLAVRMLDEISDFKLKTVFMARLIAYVEKRGMEKFMRHISDD